MAMPDNGFGPESLSLPPVILPNVVPIRAKENKVPVMPELPKRHPMVRLGIGNDGRRIKLLASHFYVKYNAKGCGILPLQWQLEGAQVMVAPVKVIRKRSKRAHQLRTFKVEISYAAQIPTRSIGNAIHRKDAEHTQDALRVLNIILRLQAKRFKSDEVQTPVYLIVDVTFPHLLSIFNKFVQIANPSIEATVLIMLICKIFWSSIYLEIPKHLFDINVFNT